MAAIHVNVRVQRHRDGLRLAGLRPIEIWVPDTRRPGFAEECLRQSRLVAQADIADTTMAQWMEQLMVQAVADMEGWK